MPYSTLEQKLKLLPQAALEEVSSYGTIFSLNLLQQKKILHPKAPKKALAV